ncbi:MFS transporter [Xenorhabdus bharatensis]|uniref:MFS transporter n=1 Tax=Xenorhabdus bharatensis TaxID=3136256 RepID=UPI0030F3CFB2
MSSYSTAITTKSANRSRFSITILAIAAFVIVTTEYLIVGLLPALARDLNVSISVAGQLVTLFAFTVMLCGPVLTVLLSHIERKRLFVTILLIFAATNALAAIAPNIWVLAVARFIPALMLPVFWGTASETAGQIVGPKLAGRAISQVYLGISAALLLGIPLGTLASDYIGWRGTFWGLAGMSFLMAILMLIFMPTIALPEKLRIKEQIIILKNPQFVANVILSVVIFTAMFTAYTYLADTLERIAGVKPAYVGWWLMGFGAIGLIGNWLGGRFVDRNPLGITMIFTLLLSIGMVCSVLLSGSLFQLGLSLSLWGIAYTALFPICQVRVMKSASHAQALAGTLNVSAANAGTGLGAIIGGLVISEWGLSNIGYVAAGIAAIAIFMMPWVARQRH